MKKGDLVSYGAYQAICLGAERLKEDFDEEDQGGLYIPQVKIVVVRNSPSQAHCFSYVGRQMWVDRKFLQPVVL